MYSSEYFIYIYTWRGPLPSRPCVAGKRNRYLPRPRGRAPGPATRVENTDRGGGPWSVRWPLRAAQRRFGEDSMDPINAFRSM